MDVSFVLLQGVLALEPLAAAFRLANEPSISFAGFLVLLKAEEKKSRQRDQKVFFLLDLLGSKGLNQWGTLHHLPGL